MAQFELSEGRVSDLLSALGLWSLPPPPAPAPPPSLAAQLIAAASAPWAAQVALLPLLAAGMVAPALQSISCSVLSRSLRRSVSVGITPRQAS